jgi:uncharacterized protein (DUF433 family)/DNA-binding transcriptional MerR regulator
MGQVVSMPPRGHYLANEVGQLAGVSGETVGQWARYGYIRASQSEPGEYPHVYSFQDVAEAILVHELLEKHVPAKVLRPVIWRLRERLGDWPLQRANLETVSGQGVPIAALLVREGDDRYELGEHGWQLVESMTIDPQRVVSDLTRGGWAVRELPDLRHIEVNPDRLSGRPTIRGRRVAAELVAELADKPDGVEMLREDYDLSEEQIDDARRWWRTTRSFDLAAA